MVQEGGGVAWTAPGKQSPVLSPILPPELPTCKC